MQPVTRSAQIARRSGGRSAKIKNANVKRPLTVRERSAVSVGDVRKSAFGRNPTHANVIETLGRETARLLSLHLAPLLSVRKI
jgi:hypothetical protein